ncbi:MAG TPA: DUF433 domain-containing protein [Steroidobacteraceae bacterium]|jgi:uncharacterized protein (DUF433 family)|nr:DUF433 domain-containing protein [Steroidobacteraceae bacterium]
MTMLANITHRDPDILSGILVFVGTRVPVRSLFDYLEGGESIDEFLHQFPSVKRESAIAVLDAAYETVAADANITTHRCPAGFRPPTEWLGRVS